MQLELVQLSEKYWINVWEQCVSSQQLKLIHVDCFHVLLSPIFSKQVTKRLTGVTVLRNDDAYWAVSEARQRQCEGKWTTGRHWHQTTTPTPDKELEHKHMNTSRRVAKDTRLLEEGGAVRGGGSHRWWWGHSWMMRGLEEWALSQTHTSCECPVCDGAPVFLRWKKVNTAAQPN